MSLAISKCMVDPAGQFWQLISSKNHSKSNIYPVLYMARVENWGNWGKTPDRTGYAVEIHTNSSHPSRPVIKRGLSGGRGLLPAPTEVVNFYKGGNRSN